jgi:octaprenyl-diphosphate synthase
MQIRANDMSGALERNKVPSFGLIDEELSKVARLVAEQLAPDSDDTGVAQLLGTLDACGGKMLRPGLVLLAGAACGRITPEHIRAAAIVEVIHNATLLHDDVMDEGQKRRGKPTANSLWGNEAAVLLGDFLLSKVFVMGAGLEPEVIRIIAEAAVRICKGELRQVVQRRNWQLGEPEYIDIITDKSAGLFACCCHLGGLLAGGGQAEIRCLADFGLNAGIAFQIVDDLLDIVGDERRAGKTLGSDFRKNKPTLAIIHLLSQLDAKDGGMVVHELSTPGSNKQDVVELLGRCGSLEYAQGRARWFAGQAVAALAETGPDSDRRICWTAQCLGLMWLLLRRATCRLWIKKKAGFLETGLLTVFEQIVLLPQNLYVRPSVVYSSSSGLTELSNEN